MSTAEERDTIRGFTRQLSSLTDEIHALGLNIATINQWMKTADKDISEHNKTLYGSNGNDGLEMKNDRLSNRVALVFAVGAGAWALFVIVFGIVAASLFEKVSLLVH